MLRRLFTCLLLAAFAMALCAEIAPLRAEDQNLNRYFYYPYYYFPHNYWPQQTQPWPGLARDMDPKPDHGETSYRGSGRLASGVHGGGRRGRQSAARPPCVGRRTRGVFAGAQLVNRGKAKAAGR